MTVTTYNPDEIYLGESQQKDAHHEFHLLSSELLLFYQAKVHMKSNKDIATATYMYVYIYVYICMYIHMN